MRLRGAVALTLACSMLGACQSGPNRSGLEDDARARLATWNSCFWRNAISQLERNPTELDSASEQAFLLCQAEERVLALSLSVQDMDTGAMILLLKSQQKQKLRDEAYKAATAALR